MFCFIDEVVLVECVCVGAKAPSLQNSSRGESQLFISVCVCVLPVRVVPCRGGAVREETAGSLADPERREE